MPAFNAELYISTSIESVLAQSYCSWQLIIVDDSSIDATFSIASSYASRDSRISLFSNIFPKGAVGARNTALSCARGRFISFLDADDLWGPKHLLSQYLVFSQGEVLCHGNIGLIDSNGVIVGKYQFPRKVTRRMMLFSNFMPNSTVAFDSFVFGKPLIPNFSSRNDYAYWLKLFSMLPSAHSCNLGFTDSFYRITGTGLSSANFLSLSMRYIDVMKSFVPAWLLLFTFPIYLFIGFLKKRVPSVFNASVILLNYALG